MTQSLLFSCSVLAQFCGLSEAGAWLLASERWVKTLLLPLSRENRLGERQRGHVHCWGLCWCRELRGLERVLHLPCRKLRGQRPRTCARPASAGCVLPLLITDPHRLFQPATFLKGSSQLRSSIRAFLAGTKFSRRASFSCPEEAYFKKLVFVGKFKTYTEVEYYSRIPFYLSCSFSGYHICQQT